MIKIIHCFILFNKLGCFTRENWKIDRMVTKKTGRPFQYGTIQTLHQVYTTKLFSNTHAYCALSSAAMYDLQVCRRLKIEHFLKWKFLFRSKERHIRNLKSWPKVIVIQGVSQTNFSSACWILMKVQKSFKQYNIEFNFNERISHQCLSF